MSQLPSQGTRTQETASPEVEKEEGGRPVPTRAARAVIADLTLLLFGIGAFMAYTFGQMTAFQAFLSSVCAVGLLTIRLAVERRCSDEGQGVR
jgi:hypothetical protein